MYRTIPPVCRPSSSLSSGLCSELVTDNLELTPAERCEYLDLIAVVVRVALFYTSPRTFQERDVIEAVDVQADSWKMQLIYSIAESNGQSMFFRSMTATVAEFSLG